MRKKIIFRNSANTPFWTTGWVKWGSHKKQYKNEYYYEITVY